MVSELTVADVAAGTSGKGMGAARIARLRSLPEHLAKLIKGQPQVLPRVCSVLTRGELGFANPRRPRGSFLFVGPTGVGKTETFNAFTTHLFNGVRPIRFDMSEYQNQGAVEKLLGENRRDDGLFGRAVRGMSRGTLLFDEVEKAHPLILDLFLQVLEDAHITLATGTTLDVAGFYVGFTSNIGSEETIRIENAPFASIERTVLMRVRERVRPELLGRITDVLVFGRLDYMTQREICESMIATECARLAALGHQVEVTPSTVEFLVRQGYHRMLGARPMRGAVERFVQEAVADDILRGGSGCGPLAISSNKDRLVLI